MGFKNPRGRALLLIPANDPPASGTIETLNAFLLTIGSFQ